MGISVWRPQAGPQLEALRRSEDEVLMGGARWGGKTEAGLAWNAEPEYVNNPLYQGLVLRENVKDLAQWIERARVFYAGMAKVVGNPPVIRWNAGGVTYLGHWKGREDLGGLLGNQYHKITLEELTQCVRSLDEYRRLKTCLRSTVDGLRPRLFATTNPGGPGHRWVKEYWVDIPEEVVCGGCGGAGCVRCDGGYIRTGRVVTSRNATYIDPRTGSSRIFIPSLPSDNKIGMKINPQYYAELSALSGPLRKMWFEGDWDVFEGQFFSDFGPHLREEPFEICSDMAGRIYGSLDVGVTHYTSFGLSYVDRFGVIHRMMTYKEKRGNHREHAEAILDRVMSFRWTHGVRPELVWVGRDAWTKQRLSEAQVRSPIDEYLEVWGKGTQFLRANDDRRGGCAIMRQVFATRDGMPGFQYWYQYNKTLEEDLMSVVVEKNEPEEYMKRDGDDTVDECRYGIVGMYAERGRLLRRQASEEERARWRVRGDVGRGLAETMYRSMDTIISG